MPIATKYLVKHGHCQLCRKPDSKFRCSGCKLVFYCSSNHQRDDWDVQHKQDCSPVRKSEALLVEAEQKLRAFSGSSSCPANPFDADEKHFWKWSQTRPYMKAKTLLIYAVREIRSEGALERAYEENMDVFRLNQSDDTYLRNVAPFLMIRLGKDQEAYDFIKWWLNRGSSAVDDSDSPYLNLRGEDLFEPLSKLNLRPNTNFTHLVALTLLKLRAYMDLDKLVRMWNTCCPGDPGELIARARTSLCSDIILNRLELLDQIENATDLGAGMKSVQSDLQTLYNMVNSQNLFYWPAFLDPTHYLSAWVKSNRPGSAEEAVCAIQNSYSSWEETPGAIDWVIDKIDCKCGCAVQGRVHRH